MSPRSGLRAFRQMNPIHKTGPLSWFFEYEKLFQIVLYEHRNAKFGDWSIHSSLFTTAKKKKKMAS